MVPPERVELSSPAPEAGTLSTELKGHFTGSTTHSYRLRISRRLVSIKTGRHGGKLISLIPFFGP